MAQVHVVFLYGTLKKDTFPAMMIAHERADLLGSDVAVHRRGTRPYERARRQIMALVEQRPQMLRTVPAEYVDKLFVEEEDRVDYVCVLEVHDGVRGFALVSDKLLTSWVPPGWTWRYLSDSEARRSGAEHRYEHTATGRVVLDDLDAVWEGRDESDSDIYSVRSLHILLICAEAGLGYRLMGAVEQLAERLGIDSISLGAANDSLQTLYRERYEFVDDRIGCSRRSPHSRALIREWSRAHRESSGLYGHLMTRCLHARKKL